VGNLESRSFVTVEGLCFVASTDSERKRDRMHILPPDNPMLLEGYAAYVRGIVNSQRPKRIFIRNDDHYQVISPSKLVDIKFMDKKEKRGEIYFIANDMFISQEVIIEDALPDEINIHNLPQGVFEPIPINLEY
jgi:hypothetical protein